MADKNAQNELVTGLRVEPGIAFATINGEIDLHSSPRLRTTLLDVITHHAPKKFVLNLAKVPYMDSSAIAVLVELLQKLRRAGGKLYLTDLQPRVKGLMEIARLDTIFVIAKDEADALSR